MRAKAITVVTICIGLACCASSQAKIQRAREKDPRYQYNMGLFYLNQNDVDSALTYLRKALSLDARYHLAWNALGLAHSMRGRLDESAKAYQKCLEVNPQFTEARNNLGTVYQEMNMLDKAEVEFRKALTDLTYQSRELPYFNLARLYVLQDRLDEAQDHVQKAIEIQPRLAMAHNLRGLILEKRDSIGQAVASYEAAVKIVPEDVLFNFNLAVAYFKNKQYARAKETFLKIQGQVTDAETRETIAKYLKMIDDLG
ncbi:MAG: tetratricopeptide repeat protein [Candidatus Aminicenantes bacterium]|nr:tetratricopeptide repeat protein [Candidatus Aminicenantes bacterium]